MASFGGPAHTPAPLPSSRDPHNHLIHTSVSPEISHRRAHPKLNIGTALGSLCLTVLGHTDAVGMWIVFKALPRRQSREPTPERLALQLPMGLSPPILLSHLLCDLQHVYAVNLSETQFLTCQMEIKTMVRRRQRRPDVS